MKTGGSAELKLLHSFEPAIDMGAGELTHIFFSLEVGCKTSLARKLNFMPVFEIDMAAPCPCIGVRIFLHYADKRLVAVRILDSVPLPVFHIGFHTATLVVVERYSKRNPRSMLLRDNAEPRVIPPGDDNNDAHPSRWVAKWIVKSVSVAKDLMPLADSILC